MVDDPFREYARTTIKVAQCSECREEFEPEEPFHRICEDCVIKEARAGSGRCVRCGLRRGGYSDNYFIVKCSCDDFDELNGVYDRDDEEAGY